MKALLLIDIQVDFLPGGALPVPNGHEILPAIHKLVDLPFDFIVATKDWHPLNHASFAQSHPGKKVGDVISIDGVEQVLWPVHCVQESKGSLFANWPVKKVNKVFLKGTDPKIDSYSAFFDNGHKRSTGLGEFLKEQGIDTLYIAGLATDYCVKFSVLDALQLGFKVFLIEDACRGIDLKAGDVEKALAEMKKAGAHLTTVNAL